MNGIEKILSIEEVAEQMMKCKLDVYQQIHDINDRLADGTVRMDDIEDILNKHEKQRQSNYDETRDALNMIKGELQSYRNDFNQHDKHFHGKMEEVALILREITEKLNKTKEETDANTIALTERHKQEEIDKAVKEALDNDHAPYQEYKKQAILAVIGIISAGVIAGTWKLVMFVSAIDDMMKGVK